MAGSNGYHNYRHQADIYSIYSILRRREIPKENIIMLSYDDVVNSPKNPYRGMVMTGRKHKNVYPGRQNIDYRGKSASASNFLRVLRNDTTNGRALNSTAEDNVLIYYDDHGAPGMLCVPSHNGPEIYGDHISETIKEMKRKKMFKKLLFIIEACYSGSVGFNITEPGVYVITAAGPQQSSYSAQWDDTLGTFKSNEFTQHVLKYIQEHPDDKIIDLVNYVSSKTTHSHVQAFGDPKVFEDKLSSFLGSEDPVYVDNGESGFESNRLVENGAPTYNTFVNFLERRLSHAKDEEEKKALQVALSNELQRREKSNRIFDAIEHRLIPNGLPLGTPFVRSIKYPCYRAAIEAFRLHCGEIDENELAKVNIFTHLCERSTTEEVVEDIHQTCPILQWETEQLYF